MVEENGCPVERVTGRTLPACLAEIITPARSLASGWDAKL